MFGREHRRMADDHPIRLRPAHKAGDRAAASGVPSPLHSSVGNTSSHRARPSCTPDRLCAAR